MKRRIKVSLDQPIEVRTRSNIRRCPQCIGKLIRLGGNEYQDKTGTYLSFTIGRRCKRCNILYLHPKFKEHKIVFNKIGGDIAKESL